MNLSWHAVLYIILYSIGIGFTSQSTLYNIDHVLAAATTSHKVIALKNLKEK